MSSGPNPRLVSTSDNITYRDIQAGAIFVDTSAGAITLTLPSVLQGKGSDLITFLIKSVSGANAITINGNGRNIDGASTFELSTLYDAVQLTYFTTSDEWFSVAKPGSGGGLSGAFFEDDAAAIGIWDMDGFDGSGNVTNRGSGGAALDLIPYPGAASQAQFEGQSSFVEGKKCIMTRGAGLYIPGPQAAYTVGDFSFVGSFVETAYGITAYTPFFSWRPPLIGSTPMQTFTKDSGTRFQAYIDNVAGAAIDEIIALRRGQREVWGIIRESDVYKVFLNGTLVYTSAALTTPVVGDTTLYIGGLYDANNYYFGEIGPACLYLSAITDEKMITLQNRVLGWTAA